MKKTLKPFHNPTVTTAHSVRRIVVCTYCNGMGSSPNMIRAGKEYAHGRCYAAINGRKALLALPQEVTDTLTIADIGGRLMKALIEQRA
jgi:hypothetical protein